MPAPLARTGKNCSAQVEDVVLHEAQCFVQLRAFLSSVVRSWSSLSGFVP